MLRNIGQALIWITIAGMLGSASLAISASPTRDATRLAYARICQSMADIGRASSTPCDEVQTEWNKPLLILAASGLLSGVAFLTIGIMAIGMADIKDDLDLVRGYTEGAIRAQRAPAPLPPAPSAPRPIPLDRPAPLGAWMTSQDSKKDDPRLR